MFFDRSYSRFTVKLGSTQINYDVPLRVSLAQVINVVEQFTRERSGGDRPLAVAAALFQIVGEHFKLFDPKIRRGKITTSDLCSGQAADLECVDSEGAVIMAVEVKDRTITVADLEEKLSTTREKEIKELFFVSGRPIVQTEDVPERVAKEFSAGQNLYVFRLSELARSVLALTGAQARRDFLVLVGKQLDEFSEIKDRLAWRKAIQDIE